jgi:acetate kinase
VDAEVEARVEECSALAPLHNPGALSAYRGARRLLPDVPHVMVFDTAFHRTMPERAYTYGLPYELCRKHKVRRYGFHGISHRYVSERYRALAGGTKLITCHLGNGCSMCAVDGGRVVDTSMGLTPAEGLLMGTRGGDMDPVAVLRLMEAEGLDTAATDALLNRESGLLGISGVSNDMRTLLADGGERARLAVDVFCYRVRKYIGAYFAVLGGVDGVVFTAGIGENSPEVRARVCEGLGALGIFLDAERNARAVGVEMQIGERVWVIPTDEELMIARETARLCGG